MNVEKQLRMAMALIQEAKECLSPMNNEDSILWDITCDLENARQDIESRLSKYISCDKL